MDRDRRPSSMRRVTATPSARKGAALSRRWRAIAPFVVLLMLVAGLPTFTPSAEAVSTTLVISQVYGGGGNTGATHLNDFIEIFNRGTTTVSVAGWSVQYASATGTGPFSSNVTTLSGSIPPGAYYLVQQSSGGANGVALPTPDATGSISMAAGGGKVVLVNSTTGLACNGSSTACSPTDLASIVDLVGYGNANYFEGSGATPAPSATLSARRNNVGCTDTDNNNTDFATANPPTPRNSSNTPASPCAPYGIGTATPASVAPGGTSLLTVAVMPAGNPTSTGLTVTGDLGSVGGSATQQFFDDGTNGDVAGGDNTFSYNVTVNNNTGDMSLPITVADAETRSSTTTIGLTVTSNPTGVGTATPPAAGELGTTLLTVDVTPGSSPVSTGLAVTGDLSSINGSATQQFFDDGSNGDVTGGDNRFSYQATVGAGATPGAKSLPITITDAQSRTGTTSISFIVIFHIHTIQGVGHRSPYAGQPVSGVQGIVTYTRTDGTNDGFYLQESDAAADDDPATSEAIFVATTTLPTVGQEVTVSGTVTEVRPGGDANNLTITQITSPMVTPGPSGQPLPAPIVIGTGGRIPPTTVIDNDSPGDIEAPGANFDPGNDGIDFYESLEGMRVQVNNSVAVSPSRSFGSGATLNHEIAVLGDNGANASLETPRGGIVLRPGDFNPERITLNDASNSTLLPDNVNVGAQLTGAVFGVMDYSFGNFKFQVTEALPAAFTGGAVRERTAIPSPSPNQLAVATFNVENLTDGDSQAKFDELAAIIITNLGAPDIVALEEIQDNNGTAGGVNDPVVAADETYAKLILAIQTAGGPTYAFAQIDPVAHQDGGAPGGNIRVALLFRTDRGLSFAGQAPPAECVSPSICPVGVSGTGSDTHLTFNPGRIDPTNSAFYTSRKPLVGEFQFNGRTIFLIANHFASKGGDQPLFGRFQPPTLLSEVQRTSQAQVVHDFVNQLVTADPNAAVVVLGDINDFQYSPAMTTLKGTILHALIETLPENERYSYVFQGNSQSLDHILVSNGLFMQFGGSGAGAYDVVHVNAEFHDQASDHDPQVARFTLDPPLIANNLNVTTGEDIPATITLTATGGSGAAPTFTIASQPAHGTLGTLNGGQVTYTPDLNYSGPDSFTYQASDGTQNSNVATVSIAVGMENDPPVANSGSVSTAPGIAVEITLNASDLEGSPLTYSIITGPTHGTLGPVSGNTVTYTPAAGYSGPDTLTFKVNDGSADSNVATISITVLPPPPPPNYTLTVSTDGNGTVAPGTGDHTAGTVAQLTADPGDNAVFTGWMVDGAFAGFGNPLSVTMNADHTVEANFAPSPTFGDVSSGTPYSEAILRLAALGIIRGYEDGNFGPDDPILRAQMAALIARAMGWDAEDHGNAFTDRCDPANPTNCIDADLWRNVGALSFYGVARGFGDGTYHPREEVAHIQMISFTTRAMVAKGLWIQATADDPAIYPNVPATSGHRLDLVTFVRYAGAIPAQPTNQPWADWDSPATRGWVAAILDQALSSRFATTP